MDYLVLKNFHMAFAIAYFVIYNVKGLFFLFSTQEKFLWYKGKTIALEMLLSVLFLASGIYLVIQRGMGNLPGVFHLKLTLVILTIPLGIIGFKRNSKFLVALSMIALFSVLFIALFIMK